MSKFVIISKNDLNIVQAFDPFFGENTADAMVVHPQSGATHSGDYEIPFSIKSTNMSIPIVKEEFCMVSRSIVNLSEQHVDEKAATVAGNKAVGNPKRPLRENNGFVELKGANG